MYPLTPTAPIITSRAFESKAQGVPFIILLQDDWKPEIDFDLRRL
jgi:hypothetical protein